MLKDNMASRINELDYESDQIIMSLMEKGLKKEDIIRLKKVHQNESIKDLVLNTRDMRKIIEIDGTLIRKDAPVYQIPTSRSGRAAFYSGKKRIMNFEVETYWFNIGIIWLMSISLYLLLYFDGIKQITEIVEKNNVTGFFSKKTKKK
jgi:hypothetical protein